MIYYFYTKESYILDLNFMFFLYSHYQQNWWWKCWISHTITTKRSCVSTTRRMGLASLVRIVRLLTVTKKCENHTSTWLNQLTNPIWKTREEHLALLVKTDLSKYLKVVITCTTMGFMSTPMCPKMIKVDLVVKVSIWMHLEDPS